MLCCDPRFRPLLTAFDQSALERHAGTIVGLWEDNTLAYYNPHWFEFAHRNGAEPTFYARWELGTSIVSGVSRPLLPFYLTAFSRCRRTQTPWEHLYECSSADEYRQFHMKLYPLSVNGELLIVHSLVVERPHDPVTHPPHAADEDTYRDDVGMVSQCMHCRRFRRGLDRDRWDWVPDWVDAPPAHLRDTLCPICNDYYYPA